MTKTYEIDGTTIEIERGGPTLWHVFARTATASISAGPFKTRKAAILWAQVWGTNVRVRAAA